MADAGGTKAGQTHEVKQGETLLSIAHQYGFRSWEVIWNHEKNKELREERKDPQVLASGDKVFIPEKQVKSITIETNKRHTFTVKTLKAWFRTEVLDDSGRPLANKRFQLEVGDKTMSGFTNEKGVIELGIDPRPTTGKLRVYMGTEPEQVLTWNLKLGNLDPIDTLSGVKARLTNLGFLCGAINDEMNEETEKALRDFQIVHRLEVTGKADDATRARLLAIHDRR